MRAGLALEVRDVITYPAITEDEDVSVANKISKGMQMAGIGSVVITKEDKTNRDNH